jgi:acetyltransferase-like isoleucine patch superfamily enzyme
MDAGSLRARLKGCEVGRRTRLSWSVEFHTGCGISLGDDVEVLRNTTLDGTSALGGRALRIGAASRLKENVWCACYGGSIEIGERVLIGRNSVLHGHGGIVVGNQTMIGSNVTVVSSEHVYWKGSESFQSQGFTREPIVVGDNVWIGANTVVLAGSCIERDVVVGAGAVVRGTLKSGYVYAGVPAMRLKPLVEGRRPVQIHLLGGRLRG